MSISDAPDDSYGRFVGCLIMTKVVAGYESMLVSKERAMQRALGHAAMDFLPAQLVSKDL